MKYSSAAAQQQKHSFLDPRVKLVLVLLLALFVMGGAGGARMIYVSYALSIIPFALLAIARAWGTFFRMIAMLIIGYGCLFALPYLPQVLSFIALTCGYVFTRLVVTVAMGEYFIAKTSVSEFIAAMERMYMPKALVVPLSVMFRMFPTIASEWKSICRAMNMRGIRAGAVGVEKLLEYQLIPMMSSSVRIGEELSAAALTRGLGSPVRRVNICQIGFRMQDWLLLLVSLLVICFWLFELAGM